MKRTRRASIKWKGKGKAVARDNGEATGNSETSLELEAVDWTRYEPPEGLTHTGNIESDMVAQIVRVSISRVKCRIIEEAERKAAAEEARRRQEEEKEGEPASEENGGPSDHDSVQTDDLYHPDQPPDPGRESSRQNGFLGRAAMRLFRKLNGNPVHGESSSAGAARQRILQSSQGEPTTHAERKRLVLDLIKKGAEENTSTTNSSIREPEVECVSCLDDFDSKDTIKAPCHHYCKPCFKRLIASACQNEQQWPPKCCLNNIPESTITGNIDEAQRRVYSERAVEWNVPMASRIYCSQPNCNLFIRLEQIDTTKFVARCECGHYTCTMCRNAEHEGADCPQDPDLLKTAELAEEEGWRRCIGCNAFVEHTTACRHMTCRCGAQFCYVCGARWETCGCTNGQVEQIKKTAEARRRPRLEREAAEEIAVRDAIRQVEEFQREEARKAELRLQEQARIAKERHERELAERIRRETERRQAVVLKFEGLRATFGTLHETQRSIVQEHNDRREKELQAKTDTFASQLRERHEEERAAQQAEIEAKMKKRKDAFQTEYYARVAEERRIEEQYFAKLVAFWGPRDGGEDKARAAFGDLQRKMDAGYRAWCKWTQKELDMHRHILREEQAIREERMDEEARRHSEMAREAALALARHRAAELRWVREVIEERRRLLEELEANEIENGEDIDAWFAEAPLEEALIANP
ncbi:hypothetical protein F5Y10DRAFT_284858 [Nemania abortiva]|nr:hypothetical protein F5Y10DRAFT_284858 [Nemania abortiva]